MKLFKRVILSLCILLCFLIFGNKNVAFCTNETVTPVTEEELMQEQASLNLSKDARSQILKEKQKVQKTIKNLKAIKNNTQEFINTLDSNLEVLNNEMNAVNSSIVEKNAEILIITDDLNKAIIEQDKQYNSMKKRIKYIYELGDLTFANILFGSKDVSDLLEKTEYVNDIVKFDRDKLSELKEARANVEFQKQKLDAEQAALVLLQVEQTAKKESIETLIDEKTSEITNVQKELNLTQAELKKLEEEERKQDLIIQQIEAKIKARNSNRVLKSSLIWPCPSSHLISSTFGNRKQPKKGASTYHKGIDISASTGANVIASADGEVVISSYNYSSGNYIMIDHGSGVFTIYMHLSNKYVKEGKEVKQGDSIGTVGSTGVSTGPHLHFGVRKNGQYVDPQQFV